MVGPGAGAPAAGAPLRALTLVSEPVRGQPPLMLGRMLRGGPSPPQARSRGDQGRLSSREGTRGWMVASGTLGLSLRGKQPV